MHSRNQPSAAASLSDDAKDVLATGYIVQLLIRQALWERRAEVAMGYRCEVARHVRRSAETCAVQSFGTAAAAEEVRWHIAHAAPDANLAKAIGRFQNCERNAEVAYDRLQRAIYSATSGKPA
jgi:hypothetical protein